MEMFGEKKEVACECVIFALKHMVKVSNSNLLINPLRLDSEMKWTGKNKVKIDSGKYKTSY